MLEIIGFLIIVVAIFAGMAGSLEGVLPVFLIGMVVWGLTGLVWKITGFDSIMLFSIGLVVWICLVFLLRKWNQKSIE